MGHQGLIQPGGNRPGIAAPRRLKHRRIVQTTGLNHTHLILTAHLATVLDICLFDVERSACLPNSTSLLQDHSIQTLELLQPYLYKIDFSIFKQTKSTSINTRNFHFESKISWQSLARLGLLFWLRLIILPTGKPIAMQISLWSE
jgi:hypothetical protein